MGLGWVRFGKMEGMEEMEPLEAKATPPTWPSHLVAIKRAMGETFGRNWDQAGGAYLLGVVRDVAETFCYLVQDAKEARETYLKHDGVVRWIVNSRPCPWDWEAMRPRLQAKTVIQEEHGEDEEVEWDSWGPRPTDHRETAAFLALSKGLAWEVGPERDDKNRLVTRAATLHGFRGLEGFPLEDPPRPSGELPMGGLDLNLAAELAEGLNPEENFLEITPRLWAVFAPTLAVGGGFPVYTSKPGTLLDDTISRFLGADHPAWKELRFRGVIQGKPWESYFRAMCRGLMVNREEKTARWVFDVETLWGNTESQLWDVAPLKATAKGWSVEDWYSWVQVIKDEIDQAAAVLRVELPELPEEVAEVKDATASPQGVGARAETGAPVGLVTFPDTDQTEGHPPILATMEKAPGGQKPEREFKAASFLSGEGILSAMGGQQLRFLNKPAPDPTKAVNLEKAMDAHIREGLEILSSTGEKPVWLEESRSRRGGGYELSKAEVSKLRGELGRNRHGMTEVDSGGNVRWVRIGEDSRGKGWEFQLGGNWRFLHQRTLAEYRKEVERGDKDLAEREKELEDKWEGALLPPQEDLEALEKIRKRRELNQARRDALTSWDRAIRILKRLRAEQATHRQETIEVDAETFKTWIWGAAEAPDNWLATIRETLTLLVNISGTVVGITKGAGSSLISWEYRRRDDPQRHQEGTGGVRGSNTVFIITLNKILTGGLDQLRAGTRTLPSGVETVTYDTSKTNREAKKKSIEKAGDRLEYSPEVHLDHFLEVLGYPKEEQALAQFFSGYITPAQAYLFKKWTTRPRGGAFEDGTIQRRYTSAFRGCHLLPAPDGPDYFHGALGSFQQNPEHGWKMGGKHNEASRTNYSLLEVMSLELPTGPGKAEDRRRESFLRGLLALRRVVGELGDGVLAAHYKGKWYDLLAPMEAALVLELLKEGKVFPFFRPGWIDRIRAAYEAKMRTKLPKTREEAETNRWRQTSGDGDGFPLVARLQAAMERRSLTQAMTAAELGVSRMTVSNWLKGRKPISPENVARVRTWLAGFCKPEVMDGPPESKP